MSDDEKITTSVKIPKLSQNATPVEWGVTRIKIQNVCARRGCLPAFSSVALPNLPATETDNDSDAKKKAIKMNRSCMAILFEAFADNETALAIAYETIHKVNWPMGHARTTMKEIEAEFEREGFQSKIT